jgi:hypothetical protein
MWAKYSLAKQSYLSFKQSILTTLMTITSKRLKFLLLFGRLWIQNLTQGFNQAKIASFHTPVHYSLINFAFYAVVWDTETVFKLTSYQCHQQSQEIISSRLWRPGNIGKTNLLPGVITDGFIDHIALQMKAKGCASTNNYPKLATSLLGKPVT